MRRPCDVEGAGALRMWIVPLLACGLVACDRGARAPEPVARPVGAEALAVAEADTRVFGPAVRALLQSSRPTTRALGARLAGRVGDRAAVAVLGRLLGDRDPGVRREASFALGGFGDVAEAELQLLGAAVGEKDPSVRGRLAEDLGRVTVDAGLPVLLGALESGIADVQRGGCMGLARRGIRGLPPPDRALPMLAAIVRAEGDEALRTVCAFALARSVPAPGLAAGAADAVGEALRVALRAEGEGVRRFAAKALPAWAPSGAAELLGVRTEDPSWWVAVQAFRSLGELAGDSMSGAAAARTLAAAVRARGARALAADATLAGGELHVLLAALEAARGVARATEIQAAARDVRSLVAARLAVAGPDAAAAGRVDCAAAELLATGTGTALPACGGASVMLRERRLRELAVDAARRDPAAIDRIAGYLTDADTAVVAAAAEALGKRSEPAVLRHLEPLLRGNAEGPVGAACDAVVTWRTAVPKGPLPATLTEAVRAALVAMRGKDALESMQGCLKAAAAVGVAHEEAAALRGHWNEAVRVAAREASEVLGAPAFRGAPARPPNPIAAGELLTGQLRVRVATDRGSLVVVLDADRAPVTVTRLVGLLRRGFYDGLTFHRVVPGFVVQGGDPHGDGYGGPGWALRDENSTEPFVRGSVGIALAGRDTGGSQLFVTHGREPHLDGQYPHVGRVVEGMDVVDRIQAGDRIREARVVGP